MKLSLFLNSVIRQNNQLKEGIAVLNKENIMDIIQSHKAEINEISSELIKAKELGLDIPELTKAAQNRLAYLYDNKYRYEIQAKAWGLIGTTGEQILGEYDV